MAKNNFPGYNQTADVYGTIPNSIQDTFPMSEPWTWQIICLFRKKGI